MAGEDHIVAQVLAGQTGEFRKLVELYHRPVFRFVRNLITDEHDAEDMTQDVFLAAFNHLKSFDAGRASMLTWLFTIARNRCVNFLKRKRPVIDGEAITDTQPVTSGDDAGRNSEGSGHRLA